MGSDRNIGKKWFSVLAQLNDDDRVKGVGNLKCSQKNGT